MAGQDLLHDHQQRVLRHTGAPSVIPPVTPGVRFDDPPVEAGAREKPVPWWARASAVAVERVQTDCGAMSAALMRMDLSDRIDHARRMVGGTGKEYERVVVPERSIVTGGAM